MGEFSALHYSVCLERLAATPIGRVGWNTVDGPMVLPVTYVFREGVVFFRTAEAGPLADLHTVRKVAFEIDGWDADTRTGWSVLVRGRSGVGERPERLAQLLSGAGPEPWAEGRRSLIVTITPDEVTGREIRTS